MSVASKFLRWIGGKQAVPSRDNNNIRQMKFTQRVLVISVAWAGHYTATIAALNVSVSYNLARFDFETTTFLEVFGHAAFVVLHVPVLPLWLMFGISGAGWLGHLPFILNSLLWSTTLVWLVIIFIRRRLPA